MRGVAIPGPVAVRSILQIAAAAAGSPAGKVVARSHDHVPEQARQAFHVILDADPPDGSGAAR